MGMNLVPDKELQEFRTEAGTTTINPITSHRVTDPKLSSNNPTKKATPSKKGNMMENMIATLPMVF